MVPDFFDFDAEAAVAPPAPIAAVAAEAVIAAQDFDAFWQDIAASDELAEYRAFGPG